MPIIYIAGPMTDLPAFNYPAFDAAAAAWRAEGWHVLNPAENFGGDTSLPRHVYLRQALKDVLRSDAIAMLPGWTDSEGAKLELSVAKAAGLDVFGITPLAASDYVRKYWMSTKGEGTLPDQPPESVLAEAERLVGGDRQQAYSHPAHDFKTTAEFWTTYMKRRQESGHALFQPVDVAQMMVLLKISREAHKHKRDSLVDIAGYTKCAQLVLDCEAVE